MKTPILNFRETFPVGAILIHADRWVDKLDEGHWHGSRLCEHA